MIRQFGLQGVWPHRVADLAHEQAVGVGQPALLQEAEGVEAQRLEQPAVAVHAPVEVEGVEEPPGAKLCHLYGNGCAYRSPQRG